MFINAGSNQLINQMTHLPRRPMMNPIDKELLCAIGENDLDGVKKAVENGADLGVTDSTGDTPLHVACSKGLLDIAKYLVERGADLLVNDAVDMTPLHLAAREGHDELLAYLLDVVQFIPDRVREDIALVASQSSRGKNAAETFRQQYKAISSSPETKYHPDSQARLIASAIQGDVEGVNAALDDGSDPDASDETGWTTLMEACIQGQSEIVKLLLNAGANVNSRTSNSGTAMFFAAAGGYSDIVEMLLEQGADPGIQITGKSTDAGLNALTCARKNGHENVVKMLLDWEQNHR